MINIDDINFLKIDGVDSEDYPYFSDAYFTSGEINGRPMTDDELRELTTTHPEVISTIAFESFL